MNTTTTTQTARIDLPNIEAGISHYAAHNADDRSLVRAITAEAGATACYINAGGSYVAFTRNGAVIAYSHPTYLSIPTRAAVTIDLDAPGRKMLDSLDGGRGWDLYLSTWDGPGNTGPRNPAVAQRLGATCPSCWMAMPLNGAACCA